jgi:hypothetical protein
VYHEEDVKMSEYQKKGIVRVFLSSTFRDLQGMRGKLLEKLISALEGAAMEKFISTGEGPQITALNELHKSDIAIFLISPYYGTDIVSCACTNACKAECGMKNGIEKISYTWCEYRTSLAETMPHLSYIVDEGWHTVSEDGAPKLQKMRKEVEREYCPRIKNDDDGIQRVVTELAQRIPEWYSDGTIDFGKFCGRRNLFKDLSSKMRKSINVHGVGGIGKTTLCEVALLIHMLFPLIFIEKRSGCSLLPYTGRGY